MAKVKIQAGVEIDTLTKDELIEALKGWRAELGRGVKFIRRSMSQTVDGAGAVSMGAGYGPIGEDMGPESGFVWAVTRINVAGLQNAEVQPVTVNTDSFTNLVGMFGAGVSATRTFDALGCVLNGGDRLVSVNTGLTIGRLIVVSIQAVELPAQLAWQLL